MRIVFDVTSCAKARRGGIATYGWELVQGCARVAPEHDYVLAVRPNRWFQRHLVEEMLGEARARLLVDGFERLTLGRPVDVLHSVGVRLPPGRRLRKVVTLHDTNVFEFPELSPPDWRAKRQRRIRQTLDRADLVIAYSEQGAAALGEHVGFPRERVRVVPLGVDTRRFRRPPEEQLQAALARHELAGRPYIVNVGQSDRRKNQDGLLRAFARARLPDDWALVVVGPRDEHAMRLRALAADLGLGLDRVRLPGWVSDGDLVALLAGASFSVCASLHEGFGLPVIEAQACGTPVVCSDRAALRETLGDCGLAFDPEDEQAFAAVIARLAGDGALRADLARRGPERVAAHYTWERVAGSTLAVLAEAAGSRAV